MGPPALKVLNDAASHPAAAVRERVKQIHDRIVVAEALKPQHFSLKLKDVPVADAVQALAQKAGVRLNYSRPFAAIITPKKVTLEQDDKPFLEALDRLCQTAGLVANHNGFDGWNLMDGKAASGELLAYAGPLRLRAAKMEYERWLDSPRNNQPSEQLRLHLNLDSEERSAVLSYAQPRAVEARDAAGRDLSPDAEAPVPPNRAFFNPIGATRFVNPNGLNGPAVLFQPPPERGGTLKRLKLVLPVEIMARRRDVLTVTDIAKASGKTFIGDGDVRLTLQTVQVFNFQFVDLRFAVSAPDRVTLEANNFGLRLTDAKGGEHQPANFNLNSFRQGPRRRPKAEDLLWWSGVPLGGFPAPIPWAALSAGSLNENRRQLTGFAQFSTLQPIGSTAKLTLFRFDRLRTELPFEFRDLPLP